MKHSLYRFIVAAAAVTVAVTVSGCSGGRGSAAETDTESVKVGLIVSLSGVYETVGTDMRDGFQLYLDTHNGQLGGREVDLIIGDEGDGPETSQPAATRLIQQEQVQVMTGIVAGGSYLAVAELTTEAEIPLLGANARPDIEDVTWQWATSYLSDEPGKAIAPYVLDAVDGPVWAIGPDYQGGHDELRGFVEEFTSLGGELANPDGETTFTPFPQTDNFLPYLSEIANSDAEAVYAFYAGKAAIDFVTQYRQSDAAELPLYGAFLTEGAILGAQGDAAEGVFNVLNYSPDLDNPANREFVAAWSERYDRVPTTFAMASWDAALVLDQAIGRIEGEVTPADINTAIGELGQIDSPRGMWQFSETTHSPIQPWYLREVRYDGPVLTNVLVEPLATVGE
jgi:branched-chain amino acid transport system substrate-binding protein